MAIDTRTEQGVLVVRLAGELDHHAAEKLRDEIEMELAKAHYKGLVLSFRGLDFMDSSGLGLILGRYRSVSQRNGRLVLCEVNPSLRRIFELSGILKIVPLYDTEESAIRDIKEA